MPVKQRAKKSIILKLKHNSNTGIPDNWRVSMFYLELTFEQWFPTSRELPRTGETTFSRPSPFPPRYVSQHMRFAHTRAHVSSDRRTFGFSNVAEKLSRVEESCASTVTTGFHGETRGSPPLLGERNFTVKSRETAQPRRSETTRRRGSTSCG